MTLPDQQEPSEITHSKFLINSYNLLSQVCAEILAWYLELLPYNNSFRKMYSKYSILGK